MINKMRMAEFCEDMCRNNEKITVKWIMEKYGLTYEEYDMLKYVTVPANAYKIRAHSYRVRLAVAKKELAVPITKLKNLNEFLKSEEIEKIINQLESAVYHATRPFEIDTKIETET